jgi:hypothetical protein
MLEKISGIDVPDTDNVVSSAYCIRDNFLDALHKSFTYNKNKRGPKIETWGTPIFSDPNGDIFSRLYINFSIIFKTHPMLTKQLLNYNYKVGHIFIHNVRNMVMP